jgi:hypothetical protein
MKRQNLKPPPGIKVVREGGRTNVYAQSAKTGPGIEQHLMERARQYASLLDYFDEATKVYGFTPHVVDKTVVMQVGQFWWKKVYDGNDDDGVALDKYTEFLETTPEVFQGTANTEPDRVINLMSARWCDQAYPVVTMGEKYFAAICATHVPPEMLDDIQAPWKCFVIEVPIPMFVWDGDEKRPVRVTRIMVQRYHGVAPADGCEHNWTWRWLAFSETGQHLWRGGVAKDLIEPILFRSREARQYYDPEREEAFPEQLTHDERLFDVIGRLVLNVCLALSDPDNVKSVGSSHTRHAKGRDPRHGPPEQRVFQLGRPIKVDCREALHEYLGGKRTSTEIRVQFLVRGHWRNQAHGPKLTLRRRQWIEPFWKGEADAPIALRPHTLGTEGA